MTAEPGAVLTYAVTASTAHMVLDSEEPTRVRVLVDGVAKGEVLTVHGGRSHELFSFDDGPKPRLLRLEFPDKGTRCYSIAFG